MKAIVMIFRNRWSKCESIPVISIDESMEIERQEFAHAERIRLLALVDQEAGSFSRKAQPVRRSAGARGSGKLLPRSSGIP
jgi:hypothetical protein